MPVRRNMTARSPEAERLRRAGFRVGWPWFQRRAGTASLLFVGGMAALFAVLSTAALVLDIHQLRITVDGSRNTFGIEAAASVDPAWDLTSGTWVGGGREATVEPFGDSFDLVAGESVTVQIAVRDKSATLPGNLRLSVVDPDPRLPGDPTPDLFDALTLSLRDQSTVIGPDATGDLVNILIGGAPTEPGQVRVVQLTIALPADLDARLLQARTGFQIHIEGESA